MHTPKSVHPGVILTEENEMDASDEIPPAMRERLLECEIPEYMHGAVSRWIMHGISPGSFLLAVLRNDLRGAAECADDENRRLLYQYVFFLYNYAPSGCWGSPVRVDEWAEMHRAARG